MAIKPQKKKGKKGSSFSAPQPRKADGSLDNLVEQMLADDESQASADISAEMQEEDHAPVVLLVYALLKEAIKRGASDIHIEPEERNLRVRYRIDGVLHEIQRLPKKLTSVIVSRLKIMAELDITERRIPQDGSIRMRDPDGENADFRMSTLPSVYGEKVVLRVMSQDLLDKSLDEIGMPEHQLKVLRDAISKPNGLVLVTGPTGSGKTTTLYATLGELNAPEKSIFTAEDPVEGAINGSTQVQTNNAVGYNFSTVLRSLLRQDPDIILVGEIRDKETIDIALKAAMTGHLVLSSLHTNDTAATVQRMLNMGVEPYLINSAVALIIAQRLVRRICDKCKEPANVDPAALSKLGVAGAKLKQKSVFHGKGCDNCGGTGYRGRAPIYEMMVVDDKLREGILKGASASALKRYARKKGMMTLRESGIDLVTQGVTTLDEVIAKTQADEEDGEFGSRASTPTARGSAAVRDPNKAKSKAKAESGTVSTGSRLAS